MFQMLPIFLSPSPEQAADFFTRFEASITTFNLWHKFTLFLWQIEKHVQI